MLTLQQTIQMKKLLFLLPLLFQAISLDAQIYTHAEPPVSLQQDNPPLVPLLNANNLPANYNVGHNTDFAVSVKQAHVIGAPSYNLYEYNTFVNGNSGESTGQVFQSSFVTFDFTGPATIEIICTNYSGTLSASNVKIRPLSKGIVPAIDGNKITFTITSPSKYAVEINGNRYRSLHVFANAYNQYTPPATPTVVYNEGVNYYDPSLNTANKKIHIKPGAVLIVNHEGGWPWPGVINLKSGDEIYIEKGGILKGGISGLDINNVKIYGGGIIDLTNYGKQYTETVGYQYIKPFLFRNCTGVYIKGVILNDSQQACITINRSNGVVIDNVKAFSRVLWGDGVHMEGTSNVTINDCFFRTSDDCIAIYAERYNSHCDPDTSIYTYKNAGNITCTNTLLYADEARPIEVGCHGDWVNDTELAVYNLLFDNIDVLEHEDTDPLGMGVISINCGDNNICADFTFRNINIEDFSKGRLFAVNVEGGSGPCPDGGSDIIDNGKRISNVKFENITYNGSGEIASSIKGINCDRYVNGVHFYNVKINGTTLTKLSDYTVGGVSMFTTNAAAYNITFQEPDNYSSQLSEGRYRIRRRNNTLGAYYYLTTSLNGVALAQNPPNTDTSLWQMEKVPGRLHYRFKNVATNTYMECNLEDHPSEPFCKARTLSLNNYVQDKYNQEWKIIPATSGRYTINNGYNYSYLTMPLNGYVYSMPKETGSNEWEFIYVAPNARLMPSGQETNVSESAAISVYPNPVSAKLTINIQDLSENILYISCYDIAGREVLKVQMPNGNELDVSTLQEGNYILKVTNSSGNVSYTSKFIKI